MSQAYGHQAWLGLGIESTYATAVAASKFFTIEKEALKYERKKMAKKMLGYVSQNQRISSKIGVSGSFTLPMLWTGTEQILKHAFGTLATAGPSSGVYTHTFSLATTLSTGLSLIVNRDATAIGGSTAFRYFGCQIGKLTLKQEVESYLMAEVEIQGAGMAQLAKPTPTFATFDPIQYDQVTVKALNPASANVDLPMKSFELTIDNALYADGYRLGSAARAFGGRGDVRKVEFKAVVEFSDNVTYAYYLGLTQTDIQMKWVKDANTDLTITIPACTFDGEDPASDNSGPYYLNISGTAWLSAADNDEVAAVLRNATAAP